MTFEVDPDSHGPLRPLRAVTVDVPSWDPSNEPESPFTYVDISSIDNERCEIVKPKYLLGKEMPSRARRPLAEGDVLFSNVRTYLRNVAQVRGLQLPAVASTGFTLLRPEKSISSRYLYHFVRSDFFIGHVTPEQTGTHYPATSDRVVRDQLVPVPALLIQESLAEIVDSFEVSRSSAAGHLSVSRQAIDRFRQAVLAVACSGRLTEEWRTHADLESASSAIERRRTSQRALLGNRYRKPTLPDVMSLPDLPDGWSWAGLSELGELGRGKSKHRPRNDPELYGGEYPFIQTGDVARSGGRILDHSQTYNKLGLAQSRLWPERTVCITIAANIADSALLTYPACFPDSVVGLVADESVALPEYVEFFVRTARRDLAAFAPATAQANINLAILSELAVALPSVAEQREIVRRVDELYEKCAAIGNAVEAAAKRVDRSAQAILVEAFHGDLVS